MGDLKDSERVSSLVLLGLLAFLQSGASMKRPFDILKKTDVVNFEWVDAVRDLQTAEARIQELQTHSPRRLIWSQPAGSGADCWCKLFIKS